MQQPIGTLRMDLHSHTTVSDGKLTPAELVQRAVNRQIQVLAITDHDTTDGLKAAQQAIDERQWPLLLVPGIEISTRWHGFEIHIVGLGIDPEQAEFRRFVTEQGERRRSRAERMGDKLAKAGWPQVLSMAQSAVGDGQITRAHLAHALVEAGAVAHFEQAFTRYLGKNKRAYVTPDWPSMEQAIAAITTGGGISVLAHPARYDMSGKWMRRLIREFAEAKGQGLEVALSQQSPDKRRLLMDICAEHKLYASAGSDFHWPTRWSDLGTNLRLPEKPQLPTVLDALGISESAVSAVNANAASSVNESESENENVPTRAEDARKI